MTKTLSAQRKNVDVKLSAYWAKKNIVSDDTSSDFSFKASEIIQSISSPAKASKKASKKSKTFSLETVKVQNNSKTESAIVFPLIIDSETEVIDNTSILKTSKVKKTYLKRKVSQSKESKKIKHIYKTTPSQVVKSFFLNIFSILSAFTSYKKQMFTGLLVLMSVLVVSTISYAAYTSITVANQDILKQVGAHIVLPIKEVPKVYILQNEKNDLFQNPLFSGVQVGDNVINYETSGKVIIYRSKEDKLVNVINLR